MVTISSSNISRPPLVIFSIAQLVMAWVESNYPSDCGIVWGDDNKSQRPPKPSHNRLGSYSRPRPSLFSKVGYTITENSKEKRAPRRKEWLVNEPCTTFSTNEEKNKTFLHCVNAASIMSLSNFNAIIDNSYRTNKRYIDKEYTVIINKEW